MENPKNSQEIEKDKKKILDKWELVSFAWELGYIIALPLIGLGLIGKWLDNKYGNETAWWTLAGIILAIVLTTTWLTKKLKRYMK